MPTTVDTFGTLLAAPRAERVRCCGRRVEQRTGPLASLVLGNFLKKVQQNPPLLWIVAAAA